MGTITTRAEQARAGRLARRVGGYQELVRRAGEREPDRGEPRRRDDGPRAEPSPNGPSRTPPRR